MRRVEIVIDVNDEEKQAMGDDWTFVGEECIEKLAVQQREYYVKVRKRKKYVRKNSASADPADVKAEAVFNGGVKVAAAAKVTLPKAIADQSHRRSKPSPIKAIADQSHRRRFVVGGCAVQ